MIHAIRRFEPVRLVVAGEEAEREATERLGDGPYPVRFVHAATDDSWVRDTGPVVQVDERSGERRALDFRFDAYGGKYPRSRDARLAATLAEDAGLMRSVQPFVCEGGGFDIDDCGTLLTTQPWLNARSLPVGRLCEALGAERAIVLPHGIAGDDTDGHVDDVAKLAPGRRVLVCREADPADANHDALAENWRIACEAAEAIGYEPIALPLPRPMFPPGSDGTAEPRLPASYANALVVNGGVVVPRFGDPADAIAQACYGDVFADRAIVDIDCRRLIVGLGAIHCLTMHCPAPPSKS